jgi:hypothetical protein
MCGWSLDQLGTHASPHTSYILAFSPVHQGTSVTLEDTPFDWITLTVSVPDLPPRPVSSMLS